MKVKYYKDKRGKSRWRVTAENGKIIGSSSQGFATLNLAKENVKLLVEALNSKVMTPKIRDRDV